MTISYSPDKETLDAWNSRLAEFNEKQETNLKLADFILQEVIATHGEQLKRQKFDASVNRISSAARELPYEQRLQLIDLIEAQAGV